MSADASTPEALAEDALAAFLAGVAAADPTKLVKAAVRRALLDDWLEDRLHPRPLHVLALGKAAPRMVWGLVEAGVPFSGVGATVKGVPAPLVDTFRWHVGEHPLPGAGSWAAGEAVQAWVDALPPDAPVLVLLSGGASACCEAPAPGTTRDDLAAAWRGWLAEGLPIEGLNARRATLSAIKAGRLGRRLLARTRRVRVWLLADTDPATAPQTVGGAPFWQPDAPEAVPHLVLASADDAVAAAGAALQGLGYAVHRHGARVAGDAAAEVDAFVAAFEGIGPGPPRALVGGGEPTVVLPAGAPPGGRAQHAALLAARRLHGRGSRAVFLAGATDGRDGTGRAAGAWADAALWGAEAEAALRRFDAHAFLERRGRAFDTGPTGTNVNDVWVLLAR